MAISLRDRVGRLESALGLGRVGGVVVALAGESFEDAARRVNRGAVIVMPPPPASEAEWERETVAQQRRLMARAAVVAAGGVDPGEHCQT